MNKVEELLQQNFDKMNLSSEDFDKFNANLSGVSDLKAQKAIAALTGQILKMQKNGGSHVHTSLQGQIEMLKAEADMSLYVYASRPKLAAAGVGSVDIIAVNTVGPYVAGKAMALPFVLWGYNDYQSSYQASLTKAIALAQQALPTLTLTITQFQGTVLFTYVNTATANATQVISIYYGGQNTNYVNLLQNQSQPKNQFTCKYINYVISDAVNGLIQGTLADIQLINITNGGSQNANEIVPDAYKTSYEFLQDRWNVMLPAKPPLLFDANLAIVDLIIPFPTANASATSFIVKYNMFCEKLPGYRPGKV